MSSKTWQARLELLEDEFLMEMGKVGAMGCDKYAEEDWRDNPVVLVKKRIGSAKRHIGKFASSSFSDLDEESNLHHLAHAAYNMMMCYWIAKHRPERDDRYKAPQKEVKAPTKEVSNWDVITSIKDSDIATLRKKRGI